MLLVAQVAGARLRPLTDDERRRTGLAKVRVARSDVPAITHVDNSARIQTVHPETAPRYHKLIDRFRQRTGCGLIVNTSFNIRGEPIVCTPQDAYRCFMYTDMDALVLENVLCRKADQPALAGADEYRRKFKLD